MNKTNPYRSYQVETASAEDQVAMLYDGARRFIDLATIALEARRYDEVSNNIGKAQRIFGELSACLNFEAGEIANNLLQLYDYWTWRLSQGLILKDPGMFQEVSATLVEMQGAWAEAAKQVRVQRGVRASG